MRHYVMLFVARVTYYLGIDALFYFLNRRAKRILTFHNVIPDKELPIAEENSICFSDKLFLAIIEIVRQKFSFSNNFRDSTTCTVTFDDGYLNQLEVAGALLRSKQIPAVVFVSDSLIDSKTPLAVDRFLLWTNGVPMSVAEKFFNMSFSSRDELWRLAVRPLFIADRENRGELAFKKLNSAFCISSVLDTYGREYFRLRYTGISRGQMEAFRRDGWSFGHHTASHFQLSALSEQEAEDEMRPPEGTQNIPFSYPYGDAVAVSVENTKLAEKLGYPFAVSNQVEFTEKSGRYFYPRFMFSSADKYLIHFTLCGLKYFLKYRRLLPTLEF